jgi:hypothetical protein
MPPQVWFAGQPPQSICPPQPLPTMPQYWPLACAHVSGVHAPESGGYAQTPGTPAPPHDWFGGQPPQSIRPPQPFPTMPQYCPLACMQLGGVHAPESGGKPHTLSMPAPPQVSFGGHPPQSILPPQPSPMTPQYLPFAFVQLAAVQPVLPQRFWMFAAPHASPAGQPPQSILPPQPSPTTPQYLPFAGEQLVTVHTPESGEAPHTFAVPPPAHVRPPVQSPQSRRRPHPSPMRPQ